MPCIIPLLMLYVVDHARAIDIIKVVIKTVDRLLGRKEGEDMDLITYVTDRKGHDMRYAIDSRKLQKELGWEPSLQFEGGYRRNREMVYREPGMDGSCYFWGVSEVL